jgi:hypothetical protein
LRFGVSASLVDVIDAREAVVITGNQIVTRD